MHSSALKGIGDLLKPKRWDPRQRSSDTEIKTCTTVGCRGKLGHQKRIQLNQIAPQEEAAAEAEEAQAPSPITGA
ncbi:hypothetical protein GOP47_0023623 [Adiantum capillus-veneris]|uniref:Uncharacterized protein n=1 Tax=Adiantum capillus-veneris TaxID=13818 RepID=A0A9D4Z3J5_ADICA|nr:hypothetical protein GOP47_0023623 [Adiantum capillus-veneris]